MEWREWRRKLPMASILGLRAAGPLDARIVLLLGDFSRPLISLRTTVLHPVGFRATFICRAVPGLSRLPQIDNIAHDGCLRIVRIRTQSRSDVTFRCSGFGDEEA